MSESKTLNGGNNKLYIYRVADTGSAYQLKQTDGTTSATSYAHATVVLDVIESHKPDIKAPLADFTLDHYQDDPVFLDFIKQAAWTPSAASSSSTIAEIALQDGTKMFGDGNVSGAPLYAAIVEGAKRPGANTRKTWAYFGTIENTAGSTEEKNGTVSKPVFKFVGKKTLYNLALGSFLRTGAYAASQTLTIPAGLSFNAEFLTLP